jgi:hypothetical protein
VTRRRHTVLLGALAVALLVAAASYGRLIPRIPAGADDVPAAVFSAPGTVLVPTRQVPGLHPASVSSVPPRPGDDRVAVYGRPDGATLTAVYKRGSDIQGLPSAATDGGAGGAMVNAHPADVVERDGDVWVTWRVFFDHDQERDQYGVLGRGLPKGAVVDAARHLVTRDGEPRIPPGGLPDDFVPLGAGAASLGANGDGVPGGTTIRWTDERTGHHLTLTAIGVNGPAADVVRAMVGGPPARVRTVIGRAGPPAWTRPGEPPEIARAWVYGDTGYLASTRGLTDDELDAVVASLRPAVPEDLARLAASADVYPLDRLVRAGETYVAGGRFPGGYWTVTATPGAKPMENLTIRFPDGHLDISSGGPGLHGVLSVGLSGGVDGSAVIYGRIQAPATTVRVTAGGPGQPVDLVPSAVDEGRWFGVRVPPPGRAEIVAYDAAGVEVAREVR